MTGRAIVVGVDPGRSTGLVALDVPRGRVLAPTLEGALLVGITSVSASVSTQLSATEQHATLYSKLLDQLEVWQPDLVVLEEPWDNVPVRLQQQGTAFWLGMRYGLALAAAHELGADVVSYPVTSARAKEYTSTKRSTRVRPARVGWMPQVPGGKNRQLLMTQDRNVTLADLGDVCATTFKLSNRRINELVKQEDPLMALGVLRFHLMQHAL